MPNTNNSPNPRQLEAFRFVAEWAWGNVEVPPEIHDAAAMALDRPSLAHGFYTPNDPTNESSPANLPANQE
ncbi:hypothetical protein SH139x_001812 [Planctomycetaceae bacterium SH139]